MPSAASLRPPAGNGTVAYWPGIHATILIDASDRTKLKGNEQPKTERMTASKYKADELSAIRRLNFRVFVFSKNLSSVDWE